MAGPSSPFAVGGVDRVKVLAPPTQGLRMASETHAVTIQLVGTVEGGELFHQEIAALFDRLRQILPETMPHFIPAHPPATITTFELFGAPTARRVDLALSQKENALIEAAIAAVDAIRGDGNGRAWIDARAADRLRAAVERWKAMV